MHKFILSLICILALSTQANAAILVFSSNGSYTTKTTFHNAIADADTAGKTIVVTSPVSITTETVPSTRSLKVEQGGIITVSGTLTINGSFSAGMYQAFSGAGVVKLGQGSVTETLPEWWYSGSGSWHTAINSALSSMTTETNETAPLPSNDTAAGSTGGTVRLSPRTYATSGTIQMRSFTTLAGSGSGSTCISYSGSGAAINAGNGYTSQQDGIHNTVYSFNTHVSIRDLGILGTSSAKDGIYCYGFLRSELKNLFISGFNRSTSTTYSSVMIDATTPHSITYSGAAAIHLFDAAYVNKIDNVRLVGNYYGIKATSVTPGYGNSFNGTEVTGEGEIQDNQYGIMVGTKAQIPVGGIVGVGSVIHAITIENNQTGGIWLVEGRQIRVTDNYFEGNTTFDVRLGDFINTRSAVRCSVTGNFFNGTLTGVDVTRSTETTITDNTFQSNTNAFILRNTSGGSSTYMTVYDNRIAGTILPLSLDEGGTGNRVYGLSDILGNTPTLLNSWANVGGVYATAAYAKDQNGIVHLRGTITGGSASSIIFTLPAGYAPTTGREHFTVSDTASGLSVVMVMPDGSVYCVSKSGTYISLSGISFNSVNR